jgi:hypothetical protein
MSSSKDARSDISTVAAYASHEFRTAAKLELRPALDGVDGFLKVREAERARADGEAFLKPPKNLIGDASTEIVPAPEPGAKVASARRSFLSTLAEPNTISVDASEHRAAVASRAGVLSAALDAAVSARAKNSIEKMLCHHLAAAHMAGMEMLIRVQESHFLERLPPVEAARLTNAAARLFEVYQSGCLALLKLKAKGRQRVIVQHQQLVNVQQGGQAVVAGPLSGGSREGGRRRKNGQ